PSAFDLNEQAFFWLPPHHWPTDEAPSATQLLDTDITTRLYLDRNEIIRIRVERDEFYDNEPGPKKAEQGLEERIDDDTDRKAPYTITASVHGDGLGALAWWENTEQEEQGMEASHTLEMFQSCVDPFLRILGARELI
ncbi:DNA-directed RNA polymerase III subunit rpc25, partial [Ceratobasidium sp. 395]